MVDEWFDAPDVAYMIATSCDPALYQHLRAEGRSVAFFHNFVGCCETNDAEFKPLYDTLKGSTSIMFCDTAAAPAKIIKEFRKTGDKPILKGAYIETAIFLGDNQLDTLARIKSKNELIGEVIGLLQSPAGNVISALQSGGGKLAGIVKTLSERPQ